ncbi:MAG: two-component system NtrC family sensor kinase [Phenylobacterium sp.]|jgi:two-component system NtrC family sensor kinase
MASLGTLTAGIAHEINNPINFVHVSAQNMQRDMSLFQTFIIELAGGEEADEEILDTFRQQFEPLYDHMATISTGTVRIKRIVQDLRVFSQLDAADEKTVNISDCLQSSINLVQTQYLKVTKFITEFKGNPMLDCHPAQLNQVFMNLITNACDAIIEKQNKSGASSDHKTLGKIVIGCQVVGTAVEITIEDNGCGMTEQTKNKLFEPFYTTKEVGSGTGLGLSISYGIVRKHEGEFVVESTLGVGSLFKLTLPI